MSQTNEQGLSAAIREVLKRAVADPSFRQLAVRDGKAAIAKVTNKSLPEGLAVQFVDNHGKSIKTIVMPDPIVNPQLLTEEELEVAAGGCVVSSCGVSDSTSSGTF